MVTHEKTVQDIMRPAITVGDSETLRSTLERMVHEKRNSLAVTDNEGVFVGMVNAIDIIKAVLPEYIEDDISAARFAPDSILEEEVHRAAEKPIKEFMNTEAATVDADASVMEAAVIAANQNTGRIVVVDDAHKPIGILTRTELKRVIGSYLGFDLPPSS